MTSKERLILQALIDCNGDCRDWADYATCLVCPMGRLDLREDGSYSSCGESVYKRTGDFTDDSYLKVASQILLDICIEEDILL